MAYAEQPHHHLSSLLSFEGDSDWYLEGGVNRKAWDSLRGAWKS